MNNLIDSHVNFGHELLKNSVSDICKDALENNIERILSINSNIYEFQKDINLIKGFNFVDITLGHHPNNTLDIKPEEIKTLLNENIKTYGELSREDTILEIQKSEIGLLLNKSDNLHSTQFTSPLKYFEYF